MTNIRPDPAKQPDARNGINLYQPFSRKTMFLLSRCSIFCYLILLSLSLVYILGKHVFSSIFIFFCAFILSQLITSQTFCFQSYECLFCKIVIYVWARVFHLIDVCNNGWTVWKYLKQKHWKTCKTFWNLTCWTLIFF